MNDQTEEPNQSRVSLYIDGSRCVPWAAFTALVALAFILMVDYYFEITSPRLLVVAVLDETAHLATAIIVLVGFCRVVNLWFAGGCLAGGMLIDIDHLPTMLSQSIAILDAERPVTHSVAAVMLVALVALYFSGRGRVALLGATLGVTVHLFRDLATGGVPLLWPASPEILEMSYWVYAIGIIVVALLPLLRYLDPTLGRFHFPWEVRGGIPGHTSPSDGEASDL